MNKINNIFIKIGAKSLIILTLLYFLNVLFHCIDYQYSINGLPFIVINIAATFISLFLLNKMTTKTNRYKFINIYTLLLLCFSAYLTYWVIISPEAFSDFKHFKTQSINFSKTGNLEILFESKSTFTTIYYSIFNFFLGHSNLVFFLASSIAWCISLYTFYQILLNIDLNKSLSLLIIAIIGLNPALIAYASVISSESCYLFAYSISLYYLTRYYFINSKPFDLCLFSIFSTFCILSRFTYIIIFSFFIVLISYKIYSLKSSIQMLAKKSFSIAFPFILVISLQLILNYKYNSVVSISPSPWGDIALMVGTSVKSSGSHFSKDDLALVGYGIMPMKIVNHNAQSLALSRIKKNPKQFINLAFVTKIKKFIVTQFQLFHWSIKNSKNYDKLEKTKFIDRYKVIIDSYFLLILFLFVISLFKLSLMKMDQPNYLKSIILLSPILISCLLHIFLNVQQRYQLVFYYNLIIVAIYYNTILPKFNVQNKGNAIV